MIASVTTCAIAPGIADLHQTFFFHDRRRSFAGREHFGENLLADLAVDGLVFDQVDQFGERRRSDFTLIDRNFLLAEQAQQLGNDPVGDQFRRLRQLRRLVEPRRTERRRSHFGVVFGQAAFRDEPARIAPGSSGSVLRIASISSSVKVTGIRSGSGK